MKLISYNEKSILNNSTVRSVNGVIMFVTMMMIFINKQYFYISSLMLSLIPILSVCLLSYAIYKIQDSVEFFEWDYTERQKKGRFLIMLILCEGLISIFLSLSFLLFISYIDSKMPTVVKLLFAIPPMLFLFNYLNVVSLFYPFFEDELTLSYKIQKKPNNWIENGEEIKDEEEIEDIIRRDFGVK